jgi:hypothetical protein
MSRTRTALETEDLLDRGEKAEKWRFWRRKVMFSFSSRQGIWRAVTLGNQRQHYILSFPQLWLQSASSCFLKIQKGNQELLKPKNVNLDGDLENDTPWSQRCKSRPEMLHLLTVAHNITRISQSIKPPLNSFNT